MLPYSPVDSASVMEAMTVTEATIVTETATITQTETQAASDGENGQKGSRMFKMKSNLNSIMFFISFVFKQNLSLYYFYFLRQTRHNDNQPFVHEAETISNNFYVSINFAFVFR